jgi:hypothetical protein
MDVLTSVVTEDIADLAAQADIPVFAGRQAQGDLVILPWPDGVAAERRRSELALTKPIKVPVVVLTGNGGHDHTLSPAPDVAWYAYAAGQTLGVLAVEDGAVAVLGHIEHGDTHIGPGVYVIRRQREQADQIRLVAD